MSRRTSLLYVGTDVPVRNLHSIPDVLVDTLEEVERLTGWTSLLLVGGPNPERGGQIASFVCVSCT